MDCSEFLVLIYFIVLLEYLTFMEWDAIISGQYLQSGKLSIYSKLMKTQVGIAFGLPGFNVKITVTENRKMVSRQ
jgi:hypothetical protein